MSTRLSLCSLMLLVPYTLTCSSAQEVASDFAPALIDDQGRPSLGRLRHRGLMYDLRDLMNPVFRAGSADAFIREFDMTTAIADDGSGFYLRFKSRLTVSGPTDIVLLEGSSEDQCVEIDDAD